jgi:hypothetical protein
MSEEKRPTLGKIATDLQKQTPSTRDPIELEQIMHQDYHHHMLDCIDRSCKDYEGDFYVVVLTKKERFLQNVIRHYFLGRRSCPTPEYDQTVYFYDRAHEELSFMWTVPGPDACKLLHGRAVELDESMHPILKFVCDFYDGTLLALSKKLNKEKDD